MQGTKTRELYTGHTSCYSIAFLLTLPKLFIKKFQDKKECIEIFIPFCSTNMFQCSHCGLANGLMCMHSRQIPLLYFQVLLEGQLSVNTITKPHVYHHKLPRTD